MQLLCTAHTPTSTLDDLTLPLPYPAAPCHFQFPSVPMAEGILHIWFVQPPPLGLWFTMEWPVHPPTSQLLQFFRLSLPAWTVSFTSLTNSFTLPATAVRAAFNLSFSFGSSSVSRRSLLRTGKCLSMRRE